MHTGIAEEQYNYFDLAVIILYIRFKTRSFRLTLIKYKIDMTQISDLFPLFFFAISSTLTPGPNNILIMNSGMNLGIKKSIPHYLGICLGFPLMVLLVSLGLGAIFTKYLWLKPWLKVLGSLYMLYLAWQILRSTNKNMRIDSPKPWRFYQAVLFQWLNPKAWLMGISTISIFTLSSNYFTNAGGISILYLLIGLPCIGCWLLFGKVLQKMLTTDNHRLWFNIGMALALVGSIVIIWLD